MFLGCEDIARVVLSDENDVSSRFDFFSSQRGSTTMVTNESSDSVLLTTLA